MTHDEIMALDACGLRLEVARVKGFSYRDESGMPNIMPDWPRDIAAAWELVEEMRGHDIPENEDRWLDVRLLYDGGYKASAHRVSYNYADDEEVFNFVIEADGETAPIAICRAYLMWKQG